MSAQLVDWFNLEQYENNGSGEQTFKIFNEHVHVTSPHLELKVTLDSVDLILYAGQERKPYTYSLSEVYLPSKSGTVPLTQTPYVIAVINSLDTAVLKTPPNKVTSYKGFTDRFSTYLLICEYFTLQGRYGLSGVTSNDLKRFFADTSDGWFNKLEVQQRFDKISAKDKLPWFVTGDSIKNPNRRTFNLALFRRVVGTSLFRKSLNDIPPSIVNQLNVPDSIRTPYKFSGKGVRAFSASELTIINGYMSDLFLSQALPFEAIDYSSEVKSEPYSSRTKTPTVEDVTAIAKFLFSVVDQGKILAKNFKEVNNLLEGSCAGTQRDNRLREIIADWEPVLLGNETYKISSIRQLRGEKVQNAITLGDAYKTYLSSVAYLTLLFTGWRLNEVVHNSIGLRADNVKYTPEDRLTLINRNIQKSDADMYERQLTVTGPQIGRWLTDLHYNNSQIARSYDESTSLFSLQLDGSGGGSTLTPELNSNNRNANPLRHFVSRHTKYPTPRQLRRYFAVIYFYQFDHPEIMALTHHYGHSSPEETEVYITDTPTRNTTRSINESVPIKNVSTSNDSEFQKIFEDARDAKLKDLVSKALHGISTAGFSKTVRAIYRKIMEGVSFSELDEKSQSKAISDVYKQVKSEGYSVEVYRHGNCTNSKANADSKNAKCGNEEGEMEREHASANLCSGCPFHEVEPQHIANLKADLAVLQDSSDDIDDIFACAKTPLEQAQTKKHIAELTAIIELYENEEYTS